jgi:hypothetical protein
METTIKEDALLEQCLDFLQSVGIAVKTGNTNGHDFLPGLSIENGCIILNKDELRYPGDILHEAGHIAVVPGAERNGLNAASIAQRQNREAEEMMAIAWSYAACIHLNIDPLFVFHDNGYQGGGSHIAENFNNKRYFGLPMLQWIGLTADEKNAAIMNVSPYPSMIKWLRD